MSWQPIDSNDPAGGNQFVLMEPMSMGEVNFYGLKRAPGGRPKPIDALPHGGRIQVVVHVCMGVGECVTELNYTLNIIAITLNLPSQLIYINPSC